MQHEKRESSKSICGNNVCEYYRITLREEAGRESGSAIFLNNIFHKIKLDLINSQTCANDCQGITGYCGDNVCNAKEVKLFVIKINLKIINAK